MLPTDLFNDHKYMTPERLLRHRDFIGSRYWSPYELDGLNLRISTRLMEGELARNKMAEVDLADRRLTDQKLGHQHRLSDTSATDVNRLSDRTLRKLSADRIDRIKTVETKLSAETNDYITRQEFEQRLKQLAESMSNHCVQVADENLDNLNDMIQKAAQNRAQREKSSYDIMKQLQSLKFDEIDRQLRESQVKLTERINKLQEEIALSGRSLIEVKQQVHKMNDTESSILNEMNKKTTEDKKIPLELFKDEGLEKRLTDMEDELREVLDRMSIHYNRIGMLSQRVDDCRQNNINTLLDFKQSITNRLQTSDGRERKEYNTVCKTLNELALQLRQTQNRLEFITQRIDCYEAKMDRSGSLCLSQSLKRGKQLWDVDDMQKSITIQKGQEEDLCMPPALVKWEVSKDPKETAHDEEVSNEDSLQAQ